MEEGKRPIAGAAGTLTVAGTLATARGGGRRIVALLLIVMLVAPPLFGQSGGGEDTPEGEEPVPYSPEEFPRWARDLRRGEIIALGAYPIALILTNVSYRLGQFTAESIKRGEFATEYAPAFVSPEQRAARTDEEQITMLVTAGVISLAVAVADYLLGRREAD